MVFPQPSILRTGMLQVNMIEIGETYYLYELLGRSVVHKNIQHDKGSITDNI